MKRDVIVGKLIAEGLSEKTLVKLNDRQLANLAERMLSEQEIGRFKEGPGENNTPDFDHYNKIVKPQLSKLGFKESYDKVMVPYGTENSMIYGNHNTGVNVVWDRKKGFYSVYVGNKKGLKTFQLGTNDANVVANSVVKYASSLVSLNEQVKKGSVVMSKVTSNPNDVKKLTDQGLNVELREKKNDDVKKCDDCGKTVKDCKCDQSHLEESPNFGEKVTKGHNGIPEFMDSKKLKESEVKKWVKGLVENEKFHSFTSKNEIMELIKVKLTENKSEPSKPDTDAPVREKPTTKPGKPKRENPFEPKHTPKPKALGEDGDTKTAPVKPKVKPGTKPKKENPFEPKHSPKPKALGEQGDKKNKMPEFMKFKNLGFKFKD